MRVRVVPKLLRHRHRPRLQAEGGCGELDRDCVVYDNQIWVHSYPVTKITKDKTYIIVVLILQCIVPQYCDLHTRDRYTAEAGLEDAATAWCWAVCDPTSEVWSCCGAGCSVQLSLALTTGRHTV